MRCKKCQGLMITEPDYCFPKVFHIYQDRCLNCGLVVFDPKITVPEPTQALHNLMAPRLTSLGAVGKAGH